MKLPMALSARWRFAWPRRIRAPVSDFIGQRRAEAGTPFALDFVESWHDHPLLIEAFAEKFLGGMGAGVCVRCRRGFPLIFTAHSVPQRTIAEGDPYEAQTKETAGLVAQAAGLQRRRLEVCLSEPGHVGRRLAWTHGRRYDSGFESSKAIAGSLCSPSDFSATMSRCCTTSTSALGSLPVRKGCGLWRAESLNDSRLLTAALAGVARSRMGESIGHMSAKMLRQSRPHSPRH